MPKINPTSKALVMIGNKTNQSGFKPTLDRFNHRIYTACGGTLKPAFAPPVWARSSAPAVLVPLELLKRCCRETLTYFTYTEVSGPVAFIHVIYKFVLSGA